VQIITYMAPYGWLVRHLHYWAGQALVVTAGVHLLRVVFTGAYVRRFNYLLGLTLFILTLGWIYRLYAALGPGRALGAGGRH